MNRTIRARFFCVRCRNELDAEKLCRRCGAGHSNRFYRCSKCGMDTPRGGQTCANCGAAPGGRRAKKDSVTAYFPLRGKEGRTELEAVEVHFPPRK